jgi:hypothetical protein
MKEYYIAVSLQHRRAGIFTTREGVARYLGVSSKTLYRGLKDSNYTEKQGVYSVYKGCVISKARQKVVAADSVE